MPGLVKILHLNEVVKLYLSQSDHMMMELEFQ